MTISSCPAVQKDFNTISFDPSRNWFDCKSSMARIQPRDATLKPRSFPTDLLVKKKSQPTPFLISNLVAPFKASAMERISIELWTCTTPRIIKANEPFLIWIFNFWIGHWTLVIPVTIVQLCSTPGDSCHTPRRAHYSNSHLHIWIHSFHRLISQRILYPFFPFHQYVWFEDIR